MKNCRIEGQKFDFQMNCCLYGNTAQTHNMFIKPNASNLWLAFYCKQVLLSLK
jgi:hypothetical protein